jgi:hypothetical protein
VFKDGRIVDTRCEAQLKTLGRELARAAQLFSAERLTTKEAAAVEAQTEPLQ